MARTPPTLDYERALHAQGAEFVIGCDEVGRGALAGPVGVGMCVVRHGMPDIPAGLTDSKVLAEKRREQLAPQAAEWSIHSAVGLASAQEIDRIGITAALALAGKRALIMLHAQGADIRNSIVLLDGSSDWLTAGLVSPPPVRTLVKADGQCASVAAASVIAKVHRDRLMIAADASAPQYGWAGNKGYGSATHRAAIIAHGPTELHRHTWLSRILEEPAMA